MRYFSVCSGIEAATVAWAPLGWFPVAFAEIEKFPSAVLAFHYPGVPNLGDITKINGADFRGKINVLVGGTPCQSFSVAGLRGGLDDERGNLALEFVRIADESNPDFVVWENVPGILSDRGNAFGCFLAALAGEDASLLPPGEKWRTLVMCLDPAGQSYGASSMPNISAWPNAAAVCSLSHVLEEGPIPARFFLSAKACAGILRRAERRKRKLPELLKRALEEAVARELRREP